MFELTAKKQIHKLFNKFNLKISRLDSGNNPYVYFEIDSDFLDLYNKAQKKTDMAWSDNLYRRQRHYILTQLLKLTIPIINSGHVVECGCWRGLSSYQISYHLLNGDFRNTFFIFDSFEGLSTFEKEDRSTGMNYKIDQEQRKQYACSLESVQNNLKEFSFIDLKKGWIPERFNEVEKLVFSFVHIDVDLYQPIRDSLQFFYPRMVKNGIIVLDDYGYMQFPGAKLAVDEFLEYKTDFFLHLPSGGAFIIKN